MGVDHLMFSSRWVCGGGLSGCDLSNRLSSARKCWVVIGGTAGEGRRIAGCAAYPRKGESSSVVDRERGGVETSDAPLLQRLRECGRQDAAAFHFPGHRRGAAAPPELAALLGYAPFQHDLPELPELDNLFAPEGVIRDAQRKAAQLFGADDTFFLVNGSTCGIQAAVMSCCASGQQLVLPRNCHASAVSAMVLSGAVPKYVKPVSEPVWGIAQELQPAAVVAAMEEVRKEGGRVGAVLLVSPTYFGVCTDVAAIASVCHKQGIPLIVDEAHGAHFKFHPHLPPTALEQGADVVVQSTHKVLGSLTQSAMLHIQGTRVSKESVRRCLQLLQSSSPSYLLLASLDAAREVMQGAGSAALREAVSLAGETRARLRQIPGIHVLEAMDPLRITVGLWEVGVTGFEADDILRLEHGVVAELPLLLSLTFAVSAGSSKRDTHRLLHALRCLCARKAPRAQPQRQSFVEWEWVETQQSMSPREAFFADTQQVSTEEALGRVCTQLLCPYPPGIPTLAPGELVTASALRHLRCVLETGGSISGASDPLLSTISVVVE